MVVKCRTSVIQSYHVNNYIGEHCSQENYLNLTVESSIFVVVVYLFEDIESCAGAEKHYCPSVHSLKKTM